ncbi:multiple RNA-binding domain-containing protein 1 [Cryptococcus neoformans A2-102-5]|nr:multiple RNA-binding domain-containing protein 1 [Cryptococcus neoformans var. grubii D17-1]OXG97929.1 multiple RNA-binding domain-containing protein 1 [Cryptococcus neoformans var. grubii A2-102-5]
MSRLIFLNLPSSLNPDSFRKTLLSPATLKSTTITDTKLVPKRRFAFVGYKDAEEAQRVKEWFDGTYAFGAGKIKVDFVKDEPLKTGDKLNRGEKSKEKRPKEGRDNIQEKQEPNKRLQEFMSVMKGVDPAMAPPEASTSTAEGTKKEKSVKGKEKSEEPEEAEADDDDAAWLRRRQAALEGEPSTPQLSADEQLILSTSRLFVRNLAFITNSESLSSHFSTYGRIDECHLPVSQTTGEPLGTAFLQFHNPEDALAAYRALDKTTFQGRLLHVLPGRAKPGQEGAVAGSGVVDGKVLGKRDEGRGEVKSKVDAKRKQESTKGVNWASLYMNSDAVAASVADRMGISKSELLNADSGNSAVKLALAETTVIEETKKYFEDAGIVLETLQPRVPRSQTTILVKNIPYGTSIQSLTDLFAPHGKLTRVLLPPAGTLGVVEFENHMDAGRAFKALAYRRLGNAVLYLEKGPVGMFKSETTPGAGPISTEQKREEEAKALAEKVESLPEQPDPTDEAGSTLFLKGLNFATTTPHLQTVLSHIPGFSFARVQMKPDPKRPGEKLSMGYGFVGFKTKEAATKALKALEGFEIDGKSLEVKFAQRGLEDDRETKKRGDAEGDKTKSTKVLVKNLPFEATKKDVRELFSAYGQLKSLRLPRKAVPTSTGAQSTRGFAFLEFTTHTEAARAMEALKHTHLLGRHLVLQWANEGEEVDVKGLREKVKGEVRGMESGGDRKRRKLDFKGGKEDEMDGLEV